MDYVAYAIEHLRDGTEECAKIFGGKQQAVDWINKIRGGFAGENHRFKLFELGKEVPLVDEVVQKEEVVKKEIRQYKA